MNKKRGILLVNLGSPDSTAVADVKTYLREFLMDKYVIDAPSLIRKMIVECFILPFRPKESAEAYESIWWNDGSPLIVLSQSVCKSVQKKVKEPCELAMRYGSPSIESGLQALLAQHCTDEILLVPLYPHYAMATTKTVVEKARDILSRISPATNLQVLPPFYDDEKYIAALAESAASSLEWDYDHVLFSFHGLPERHLKKTDPTGTHCMMSADCCKTPSPAHKTCYRHQCMRTVDAFLEVSPLPADKYSVAFQSRLGVDKWLQPSTVSELERLAKGGVKKLLVMCPAFVADCIETLEEIGLRGRELFQEAGGEELRLIPCLNDHPKWVEALTSYCNFEEMEKTKRGDEK